MSLRVGKIDPITLEILKNALISVCKEIGDTMQRMAYSPIFSEARDFSAAILDNSAELIAQFSHQPAQLGAMSSTVEYCVKAIGVENIEEGDIILQNDSYRNSTHLPEVTVVRPAFHEGEVIAYIANMAHFVDIGGAAAGGFSPGATEVFQEGIRIPPVRVWRKNELNEDVLKIFLNNVRLARDIEGDINALIASVLIGEKRTLEHIKKYGVDTFRSFCSEVKDYSERRIARQLLEIPDGIYRAEECMDDDGISQDKFTVRLKLIKDGSKVIADYTGSDRQVKGPLNATWAVTASATYNAIIHLTDPSVPINSGCFRCIKVIAPPGTIVNVDYPGALVAGHTEFSNHIVGVVVRALKDVMPERVIAGSGDTFCNFSAGGIDLTKREYYAFHWFSGTGQGGRFDQDGLDAVGAVVGNADNIPVEIIETKWPCWIIESLSFRCDSGGAGRFRGGLGTSRRCRVVNSIARVNFQSDRGKYAAPGLFGGKDGARTQFLLKRADSSEMKQILDYGVMSPTKFMNFEVQSGDVIVVDSPGGGGYGDPLDRDPERVLADVKEGYVSLEAARTDYGVVLDTKTLQVNELKTVALRSKLRKERTK